MTKVWSIALFIAACGRQQGEAPPKDEQHARLEGDIAITIGDCAPTSTRFVSGPEPQALTAATRSLYATMSPSGDVAAGFDAPAEHLALGVPTIEIPGLPPAVVQDAVKRKVEEIGACVDRAGEVTAKFVVGREGEVLSSQALGMGDQVSSCIAQVIKDIKFPKPAKGLIAKVSYPMSFDGGAGTSAAHHLTAPKITASSHYVAGIASPLAELRLALIDCFREQDKHIGIAVFDLAPGAITSHGIDNAAFKKCVGTLASQVKVKQPTRCSAAFGAANTAELPHIDLKPDAVAINGSRVDVKEGGDEWWRLEPIFQWSSDRVRTTLASSAPVTLHGPIIVRPAPTTQMKIITKLVHTLVAAGDDPMLATERATGWQLLHARTLPVVPVPLGTGGSWNSDKAKLKIERVSILVGKKQLFIDGKPATDDDLAKQQGAVEIAAEGEVPYSRFVEVVDKLTDADWSLTSGRALAKPPQRDHMERTTRQDARGVPISK